MFSIPVPLSLSVCVNRFQCYVSGDCADRVCACEDEGHARVIWKYTGTMIATSKYNSRIYELLLKV